MAEKNRNLGGEVSLVFLFLLFGYAGDPIDPDAVDNHYRIAAS